MGLIRASFAFATVCLTLSQTLFAKPHSPKVVQGNAAFSDASQNGLAIAVSDKAIIDWNSFSIGVGETVQFVQPSQLSAVLNRDVGGDISRIFGTLSANGRVYVINPRGVIIGDGAVIDTAAFIASTLDALNADFLKDGELKFTGEGAGNVINLGTIKASMGDVILIGRQVVNNGTLEAKNGTVALAEGFEVLLKPEGKERIFIKPKANIEKTEGVGIDQQGLIEALQVELKADGNPYTYAIKGGGKISALSTEEREGKVFLVSEKNIVEVSGTIVAGKPEGKGGEVRVASGEFVHLAEGALIDASGDLGGGKVFVGGGLKGKDPEILNAAQTVVAQGAIIRADARVQGDGGDIIVRAHGETGHYGQITAHGGEKGGNGGFVEVSSKNFPDIKGVISTAAPAGQAGTLLIDPVDITIASANSNIMDTVAAGTATVSAISCTTGTSVLSTDITGTTGMYGLAYNNVIIDATTLSTCGQNGDIYVLESLQWSSNNTLTLKANNNILVAASIEADSATFESFTNAISLEAGNSIYIGFTAPTAPATIPVIVGSLSGTTYLSAGADVQVGYSSATSPAQVGYGFSTTSTPMGPIYVTAGGSVSVNGGVGAAQALDIEQQGNYYRAFAIIGSGYVNPIIGGVSTTYGAQTNITVTAGGNVNVTGGSSIVYDESGNSEGNFAQIGNIGLGAGNSGEFDVSGTINVMATNGEILVQGGNVIQSSPPSQTNYNCYAKIGHLGSGLTGGETNTGGTYGTITLSAGTNIAVYGGSDATAYAQVGHGGLDYNMQGAVGDGTGISLTAMNGYVDIGMGNSVTSSTTLQGFSQIGHGGSSAAFGQNGVNDPITINSYDYVELKGLITPTDLVHMNVYAQIGHGGVYCKQLTYNSAWTGTISVTSTTGDINILAGDQPESYAQIGHGGFDTMPVFLGGTLDQLNLGDISVVSKAGSITLQSASGSKGSTNVDDGYGAYAMIGHGGATMTLDPDGLAAGTTSGISGDITVTAQTGLHLYGPVTSTFVEHSDMFAPAQIGHGGATVTFGTTNEAQIVYGDIQVTVNDGSLYMYAQYGSATEVADSGAWIGHGEIFGNMANAPITVTDNLLISVPNGGIFLHGGLAGSNDSRAVIGDGLDRPSPNTTFVGTQEIYAGKDIILQGEAGNESGAVSVGTAIISYKTSNGGQLIGADGNIEIYAGTGVNADAGIVSFGALQGIAAKNNILALGGQDASNQAQAYIATLVDPRGGTLGDTGILADEGSVIFQNGQNIANGALFNTRSTATATSGAGLGILAAGDIHIAAGVTATGSHPIGFEAGYDNGGFGALLVDTGLYAPGNVQSSPGTGGVALVTDTGEIYIASSDKYFYGSLYGTGADFQIGLPTDTPFVLSLPCELATVSGNILVESSTFTESFRNIFITGNLRTAGDTLFVKAQNNIEIRNIKGNITVGEARTVRFVVDNQGPYSPQIGGVWSAGGAFTLDPHVTLISAPEGVLEIWTAKRSLNTIDSDLNTQFFVEGPYGVDSPTEKWKIWYPHGAFGGEFYTIFYKEPLPPVIKNPLPAIFATQLALAQDFTYIEAWNDYLFWALQFSVAYNRQLYKDLKESSEMFGLLTHLEQNYERSPLWSIFAPHIDRVQTVSSYDLITDREYTLPPQWKADGKQYNENLY